MPEIRPPRGWVTARASRSRRVRGAAFLLLLLALPGAAGAQPPPRVTAESVLLVDLATGQVLYAKNAEEDRAPASLVKLMTVYLSYEALRAGRVRLDDEVTVSAAAAYTPRFRLGLRAGQVVLLRTLLAAVAVVSANDAATAVAEHLAGSEEAFVAQMNEAAERMGLVHTVFANAHGLPDPRQRTTAREMGILAGELVAEFPESLEFLKKQEFVWRGRRYLRGIPLFWDPGGVTALKTGFTLEAGYNVAVAAEKAGQQLLCVILGAASRGRSFLDAQRLLKFGFGEPVNGRHPWRARSPRARNLR